LKIKVCSDLHLEFSDVMIPNNENADVLVLSGDIMISQDLHDHPAVLQTVEQMEIARGSGLSKRQQMAQRYRDFLKRCSFQYRHVVYVAGNHEFYQGKFYAGIDYLREECLKFHNVHFLECDTVTLDGVVFIGGTLWTDMNGGDPLTQHAVRDMMNDFRIIRNDRRDYARLSTKDVIDRHVKTKQYFEQVLKNHPNDQCVVVGHHGPTFRSVHKQYEHDYLMNGAYHSDLSEFILDHPQIKLWTMGHTHHSHWYYVGNTLVTCNPRGYHTDGYDEHTGWDPAFVVDLNNMPDPDYVAENYDRNPV
jgi:Icc-related predicted phosphoesterase